MPDHLLDLFGAEFCGGVLQSICEYRHQDFTRASFRCGFVQTLADRVHRIPDRIVERGAALRHVRFLAERRDASAFGSVLDYLPIVMAQNQRETRIRPVLFFLLPEGVESPNDVRDKALHAPASVPYCN